MRMVQNFHQDFATLTNAITGSEPFALARFADGERAFCAGYKKGSSADGWRYDGKDSLFAVDIRRALKASLPGYYLGLSCFCCDSVSAKWYQSVVKTPLSRQTYSNIFVNANYEKFKQFIDDNDLLKGSVLVGSCPHADVPVPKNAINPHFDYSATLAALLEIRDKVILVAAGPMSCVLIHQYWVNRPSRPCTIVDIGSALDEWIHGRPTRKYHRPDSPTAGKVCKWFLPPP